MSGSNHKDGNHAKKKRRLNGESQVEASSSKSGAKLVEKATKIESNNELAKIKDDDTTPKKAIEATPPPHDTTTSDSAITPIITTVYIGNLHPRIQQAHVEKLLGKYGRIERLDVLPRKGISFCQYSDEKEAQAAMQALDGQVLLGRTLKVQPAKQQQSRNDNNDSSVPSMRRLIVTAKKASSSSSLDSKIQALKPKLNEKKES